MTAAAIQKSIITIPQLETGISRTEKALIRAERALNMCGYIPVVSSFTGAFRVVAAVIQLLVAALFALLLTLVRCAALSRRCWNISANGLANIFRGAVEKIPLAGNLACYLYDRNGRVQYLSE